jgi:hypothetical protein
MEGISPNATSHLDLRDSASFNLERRPRLILFYLIYFLGTGSPLKSHGLEVSKYGLAKNILKLLESISPIADDPFAEIKNFLDKALDSVG